MDWSEIPSSPRNMPRACPLAASPPHRLFCTALRLADCESLLNASHFQSPFVHADTDVGRTKISLFSQTLIADDPFANSAPPRGQAMRVAAT